MGKILCATRGGEASYRTQDVAIALAQEHHAELIFLFVVDMGFLDKTERAVRPDVVEKEMIKMGEFLLAVAQERAATQGVQAQMRIRRGKIRQELKAAVQEERASQLILGRPAGETSAFQLDVLERLAAEIQKETGVQVQIA
jgi:nucleotide-binding universal stress UspA family protein